ncbi:MAG: futalosine hydrolase [Nitrospirae bacterium]|nr:MAG: futalosine hydrolase [Nitrospirota bacterium]
MVKHTKIGLISAVPFEGKQLLKKLTKAAAPGSGVPLYTGTLSGLGILYAVSGLGKVNAAHAATLLITAHAPSLLINFGVGGAYPFSGIGVGDVALATGEIYVDEGVLLKDGLKTLDEIGIPLVRSGRIRYYNEFPLHTGRQGKVIDAALARSQRLFPEFRVAAGPFATVSACSGTTKRGRELAKRFNVICENMEGGAVAQVCAIHKVPLIEVRGISNLVEDRAREKWDLDQAAANCQMVLIDLIASLGD